MYDLFVINTIPDTLHSRLHTGFKDEHIFIEIADVILGVMGATMESDCGRMAHCAEGYFMDDEKL